jgi:hypothetical protein
MAGGREGERKERREEKIGRWDGRVGKEKEK